MIAASIVLSFLLPLAFQEAGTPSQQPTHVPTPIRWHADLASAQAASRKDGRPVLAYFTFET